MEVILRIPPSLLVAMLFYVDGAQNWAQSIPRCEFYNLVHDPLQFIDHSGSRCLVIASLPAENDGVDVASLCIKSFINLGS